VCFGRSVGGSHVGSRYLLDELREDLLPSEHDRELHLAIVLKARQMTRKLRVVHHHS
jgi:hypothetical protein